MNISHNIRTYIHTSRFIMKLPKDRQTFTYRRTLHACKKKRKKKKRKNFRTTSLQRETRKMFKLIKRSNSSNVQKHVSRARRLLLRQNRARTRSCTINKRSTGCSDPAAQLLSCSPASASGAAS